MASDPIVAEVLPEETRYRLLIELADLVDRSRDLSQAFQEFAPPLLSLTKSEFLSVSLHDPHRGCMRTNYWKKNRESGEFEDLPIDLAATGWSWKHQETLAIDDLEREQRFPGCKPVLLDHGVRSYTVLPISTRSRQFGALGLGKSVPGQVSDEDVEFLSRVALIGALSLEREKAYKALEEQQSLVEISRQLSSSLELDKLLLAFLDSVRNIARYGRTALALLDQEGNSVEMYGSEQEWGSLVDHETALPLEQSFSKRAIQTKSAQFFSADDLRTMSAPLARAMHLAGIRSVCSIPLIASDRVWGALNVSSEKKKAFGPSEVEYLQQVAMLIGTALRNANAFREIDLLKHRLAREKRYLESELRSVNRPEDIIGGSVALKRVLDHAAIVADTDSTVLITGETGTGKERVARAIHNMSRRADRNFIKLNCAAIPTGLLESELFGHEKGAFTGAVSQKLGRLELADKGTLLLDEIGDIPLELQPKLLRVLQDQEFERLGGTKTIRVDVRLIAATNRDLARAVEEKEFRSDLFYRLHVFPLHMPALRERQEDIPALVRHFVEKSSIRLQRHIEVIPEEAIRAMMKWRWPGNIRELENFIERSVILSEGKRLKAPLGELHELRIVTSATPPDADTTLRQRERDHIVEILRQTRGSLSGPEGAATRLGLKRTTLQYKMQRLGISRTDYLDG